MRKYLLFLFVITLTTGIYAQEEEFTPSVQYGIGMIGQTTYQQTNDAQGYLMDWAGLKKGFIHTNVFLTPSLSGKLQLGYHSPNAKIFEFYVNYKFDDLLSVRAGKFKGGGPRAHFEDAIYDQEFTEIPYSVTEFARGLRIPDFRRYGLQAHGKWEYITYKLFWHDDDGVQSTPPTQQFIDREANRKSNVGLKLTNFDVFLSFTPIKDAEFGGHFGKASFAGMGRKSIHHYSAFFYYNPNKLEFKLDYLHYQDVIFEDNFVPESDDFSYHPYNTVNKKGYSFYTGYNFHPKLKFGVRFEHFDHGTLGETPSKQYEYLDIYTAGLTFYPLKGSRRNKLVLFYEYFDERNTVPGFRRPNNIIALAAQLFIIN